MSCQFYRQQIELKLDGELSAREGAQLNSHLQQCPPCRQYQADALVLWDQLAALELDPPKDIAGPVMSRLARRKAWRQLGIAAIFLLAAVSLFPVLVQGIFWARTALLSIDWHWLPTLLGTIWQALKVLIKGLVLLAEVLPQEYWLGLAGLVVIDMAMLVKIFSLKPAKGAR